MLGERAHVADVPSALPLDSSGPPVRRHRALGDLLLGGHLGDPGSLDLAGPVALGMYMPWKDATAAGRVVVRGKGKKDRSNIGRGVVCPRYARPLMERKFYPSGNSLFFSLFSLLLCGPFRDNATTSSMPRLSPVAID